MTEERELRIAYNELMRISFECPACGTEIIIDLAKHLDEDWLGKGVKCPLCPTLLDSQLRAGLVNLSAWFNAVNKSGQGNSVFFRIKKSLSE